jgi:uncharacterized protein involved in tolerance to divalent cations
LAIIAAGIMVGIKVVPAYFSYYRFQDAIEQEARIQTYTTKTADEVRQSVWKKAQEYDLPLSSPEEIKVERTTSSIAIETEYTVHVDVPIHPFDLKFQPSTRNKQI